ncbi:MAG: class I SAM-dependent methyltransferase, partial [Pseudomonadales bacterium]|nr:class I SAM-dependent methyltransferase [Pseudomonadales bacterium]
MKAERDELAAIHERYARRTLSYEPWAPWVWRTHRALELALIQLLRRHRFLPAADTRLLEVGCGGGANLQMFLRLGFRPNNLAGIELQSDRAAAARQLLPTNVKIRTGDASTLEVASHSVDIVFKSLIFTS